MSSHPLPTQLDRFGALHAAVGWVFLVLFSLLTPAAVAQTQLDAYSAEVAVADRSAEEKEEAYQVAMRRILLSNSGDKTLLNRDDVRSGLRDAESYVDLFRYRTPEPGTVIGRDTPITDTVRRSGEATQLMFVRFDQERIDELIEQQAPAQDEEDGTEEPIANPLANVTTALVWMLINDGERDVLVTGEQVFNVQQRVREIAGGAGLSMIFPGGDEIDQAALAPADIRNGDIGRIRAASERYAQPVILVANLARSLPRGWTGQWIKLAAEDIEAPANGDDTTEAAERIANTSFESGSLDSALQQGIGWLSPQAAAAVEEKPAYAYGVH